MNEKPENRKPLSLGEFAIKITTLSENWGTISEKIKKRDGRRCMKCRIHNKKNILVHHKDQNQSNNDLSNLVTMCWECHNSIPTIPIEELYTEYLNNLHPPIDTVAYMDSQPQLTGEEKSTNAPSRSPERGRPVGATEGAEKRRELRQRDFKSDKKWEEWWFKKINSLCLRCRKKCKQSQYVKILICPQYEL